MPPSPITWKRHQINQPQSGLKSGLLPPPLFLVALDTLKGEILEKICLFLPGCLKNLILTSTVSVKEASLIVVNAYSSVTMGGL